MTVGQAERIRHPTRGMLIIGGMVLAISVAAFFRVPLLPSIGKELGMTTGQLGLVTTTFAVGRLMTDIPAGRVADRWPAMWTLGAAGLVLTAGSVALATAPSVAFVIGAAFFLGIASAVSNTTGMTFFSEAAPPSQRGMAMAGFSAALLGGQAFGPMLGGVLAGLSGWRPAILVAAAVGVVVAGVGVASWRRGTGGADAGRSSSGERAPPSRGSPAPPATLGTTQRALLYSVPFASFFMLGSMPQTLVPIIGDEQFGLSPSRIGIALGIGGGCRLIGSLVGGRLADQVSRKASLVPGLVLCAVGVATLAVDLGVVGWVAAIVLLSLGSYGISVSATMLADHAGGASVGRRLGPYRFVGDIGLVAGPVVSAAIYQHLGQAVAVLVVAALLAASALLCGTVLHETRWLEHEAV